MKNTFWKRERIEIMIALALFNYVFLGAEYLFDNMMAFQTDSGGEVLAQPTVEAMAHMVVGLGKFSVVKGVFGFNVVCGLLLLEERNRLGAN